MESEASAAPAGWYDDPERPEWRRYWDGAQWTEQRASKPPPRPRRRLGCGTLALVLGIGLPLAIVVWFFLTFYWPFWNAESKLRDEADRLSVGTQVSERYRGGHCMDNCPELRRCYAIGSNTIEEGLIRLAKTLETHGYRTRVGRAGPNEDGAVWNVFGFNNRYEVSSSYVPGTSPTRCAPGLPSTGHLSVTYYLKFG